MKGKRLWPGEADALGYQVTAGVAPGLNEQAGAAPVKTKLVANLSILIGRLFHSYDLEDKTLNPHQLGEPTE